MSQQRRQAQLPGQVVAADEPQPPGLRRKVDRVAFIEPPISGVTVYFKVWDVDDPFDQLNGGMPNVNLIDPTPTSGPDNRPSGQAPWTAPSATTDEFGEARVTFTVSMQPGNNFRAGASLLEDALTQATQTTADNRSKSSPSPGDSEGYSVPLVWSQMLTVWRKLHVESDSMVAVAQPPSTGHNRVLSRVVSLNGDTLTIADSLADGSAHLPAGLGRFQNGSLIIGMGAGVVTRAPLFGNRSNYVEDLAAIELPFAISGAGPNPPPQITGLVIAISTTEFTLVVGAGALGPQYVGGMLFVAGVNMPIASVDASAGKVTVTAQEIPVELRDDDDESLLPQFADFSHMRPAFQDAYILPLADGGSNPANNQQNIGFARNVTGIDVLNDLFRRQDTPASAEQDEFWVGYLGAAYQYVTSEDYDPGTEIATAGINDAQYSNTEVASGSDATWVFLEVCREAAVVYDPPVGDARLTAVITAHEFGHQMGLGHLPDSLMAESILAIPYEARFAPAHLHLLRSRVHSPRLEP